MIRKEIPKPVAKVRQKREAPLPKKAVVKGYTPPITIFPPIQKWWETVDMQYFTVPGDEDLLLKQSVKILMERGATLSGHFTGSSFELESMKDWSLSYGHILITYRKHTRRCLVRISQSPKVVYLKCLDPIFSICGFSDFHYTSKDLTLLNKDLGKIFKIIDRDLNLPHVLSRIMMSLMGRHSLEDIENYLGSYWERLLERI